MDLAALRKIIREELAVLPKLQDNSDLGGINLADIEYLKNFSLIDNKKGQNGEIWKFEYKTKDYLLNFFIKRDKKDAWSGELKTYWKKKTKEATSGGGKDFQMNFGPYHSFEKFVENINLKLKNHPLISTEIYNDDWNANLDALIKKMILELKEKIGDLHKISNLYFNDLKKLYNKVINIKDDDLLKFANQEAPTDSDKQNLILILQKIHKIPFYVDLERYF